MNELKFQFTTFTLIAVLAFGGYWAFTSLDKGVSYSKDEVVAVIDEVQQEPVEVIEPSVIDEEEEYQEETPSIVLSEENKKTLEELRDLIVDNIFMKEGSRGTRVGTVQKFLNLYLDTESTVDNQYGPGTLRRVKEFQERENLSADGLAGPATYQRMIDIMEQG